MLKAIDIHKSYGQLKVLKGIGIQLEKGEVVALVGSSGAGKSTLLQILGTLDKPDIGSLYFENTNIVNLQGKEQAEFRNRSLGFVFQFHHLLPEFNALENVCMPAWIQGNSGQETTNRAKELLAKLGLKDRILHKPSELSGGERQRVSVARAMINQPKLILADEPTGNLDSQNSEELYNIILELVKSTGVTFLLATHDLTLAKRADRTLQIRDGIMVKE